MAAGPIGGSGVLPQRQVGITWNALKTYLVLVLDSRPTKTVFLEVGPRQGVFLKSCTGDSKMHRPENYKPAYPSPRVRSQET